MFYGLIDQSFMFHISMLEKISAEPDFNAIFVAVIQMNPCNVVSDHSQEDLIVSFSCREARFEPSATQNFFNANNLPLKIYLDLLSKFLSI